MTKTQEGTPNGNGIDGILAAAEAWDASAQLDLANRYHFGDGVGRARTGRRVPP